MKHLNNNPLAIITYRTTGTNEKEFDLLEVCCLLLNKKLEPDYDIMPFLTTLKPKKFTIEKHKELISEIPDVEESVKNFICKDYNHILDSCVNGIDPDIAAELFLDWFEDLNLRENKTLMPICVNWAYGKPFLINWLSYPTFNYIFHPYYRDMMCVSLHENDKAGWLDNQTPYPKNHFQFLCSQRRVPREGNRAADNALSLAELYKKMLKHSC